ncbi:MULTISPECIES: aminotransferase class IV family protein [unclassified Mesorhizobium]|uniref:aminotransferase class IV family protein n=1 Tax=unclassified Mesorhizobium TaxID=325217 RepID=UPI0030146756
MPSEGPFRDGNPPKFELIETLRWEPAQGFVRLERHLTRLEASARDLGFRFERAEVARELSHSASGSAPLRIRLTLDRHGIAKVTTQPFVPLPADTVWKLAIANVRLDSTDMLLRHKTTKRTAYEAARVEFPPEAANEVILCNERGEICEGTITTLFADVGHGLLRTPALHCGLLAGVLRVELLETGKAIEAVLTIDDLHKAKALFVGNSLRGLIRAQLA